MCSSLVKKLKDKKKKQKKNKKKTKKKQKKTKKNQKKTKKQKNSQRKAKVKLMSQHYGALRALGRCAFWSLPSFHSTSQSSHSSLPT
jgi:outer membrane biosynthesis protein TonB